MLSAKDLNRPGENIENAILQKKYQDERSIDRASILDPSTYTTGWAVPLFWYIVCKKIEGTLSQWQPVLRREWINRSAPPLLWRG